MIYWHGLLTDGLVVKELHLPHRHPVAPVPAVHRPAPLAQVRHLLHRHRVAVVAQVRQAQAHLLHQAPRPLLLQAPVAAVCRRVPVVAVAVRATVQAAPPVRHRLLRVAHHPAPAVLVLVRHQVLQAQVAVLRLLQVRAVAAPAVRAVVHPPAVVHQVPAVLPVVHLRHRPAPVLVPVLRVVVAVLHHHQVVAVLLPHRVVAAAVPLRQAAAHPLHQVLHPVPVRHRHPAPPALVRAQAVHHLLRHPLLLHQVAVPVHRHPVVAAQAVRVRRAPHLPAVAPVALRPPHPLHLAQALLQAVHLPLLHLRHPALPVAALLRVRAPHQVPQAPVVAAAQAAARLQVVVQVHRRQAAVQVVAHLRHLHLPPHLAQARHLQAAVLLHPAAAVPVAQALHLRVPAVVAALHRQVPLHQVRQVALHPHPVAHRVPVAPAVAHRLHRQVLAPLLRVPQVVVAAQAAAQAVQAHPHRAVQVVLLQVHLHRLHRALRVLLHPAPPAQALIHHRALAHQAPAYRRVAAALLLRVRLQAPAHHQVVVLLLHRVVVAAALLLHCLLHLLHPHPQAAVVQV